MSTKQDIEKQIKDLEQANSNYQHYIKENEKDIEDLKKQLKEIKAIPECFIARVDSQFNQYRVGTHIPFEDFWLMFDSAARNVKVWKACEHDIRKTYTDIVPINQEMLKKIYE